VDNVTAHTASTERKEKGLYRRNIMARRVTTAQKRMLENRNEPWREKNANTLHEMVIPII